MQQFRGFQRVPGRVAMLAVLLLAGCVREDPERAVRARIDAMEAAIDVCDLGRLDDLLATDFIGNDGMDRRAIRQLATAVFLRHRVAAGKVGPVTIELRGDSDAIARFNVIAMGGSGGLLPESGQIYMVEMGWHLVDGEWKLRNARWTPHL